MTGDPISLDGNLFAPIQPGYYFDQCLTAVFVNRSKRPVSGLLGTRFSWAGRCLRGYIHDQRNKDAPAITSLYESVGRATRWQLNAMVNHLRLLPPASKIDYSLAGISLWFYDQKLSACRAHCQKASTTQRGIRTMTVEQVAFAFSVEQADHLQVDSRSMAVKQGPDGNTTLIIWGMHGIFFLTDLVRNAHCSLPKKFSHFVLIRTLLPRYSSKSPPNSRYKSS